MAEIRVENVDQVNTSRLLQAAMTDNVGELKDLIRRDPNILHKFSVSSFTEPPLHISSLRGHPEFTKILLNEKPDMAIQPNSKGYCPLHYASAEGHVEVVKALLKSRKQVCMFRVEDGKIPLHFAVMRNRVDVVKLLVAEYRKSIAVLLNGETIFHWCVRYNRVESLKELVKCDRTDEAIKANGDGNTILHLAAMLRHLESLKYMISVPKLKAKINDSNKMGFSALDLLEYVCPKDLETLKVGYLLVGAGATRRQKREDTQPDDVSSATAIRRMKQKFKKFVSSISYEWLKEARGSIMVVATVIAQMTYQSAINPPGGVWQETKDGFTAGTTIIANRDEWIYSMLLRCNSAGFATSLGIILLIISGFPVDNKYFLLVISLAMCASITSVGLTYVTSIVILSPDPEDDNTFKDLDILSFAWIGLLVVAGLVYAICILNWIIVKLDNREFVQYIRSFLSEKIGLGQHQQTSSSSEAHVP